MTVYKHYYTELLRSEALITLKLGTALRRARVEREMTQAKLSKLVGISQGTLCNIEKNRHFPRPKSFKKICKKLKLDFALMYSLYFREYMKRESARLKCYLFSEE